MVVVGYARTSRESQDISSQIAALNQAGIGSEFIFQDEGVSGTKAPGERPGYKRLKKLVEAGGVTDLYVFELSRLGRDTITTLEELIRLEGLGIRITSLSPREGILKEVRPEFRPILISALQLAADLERAHISERTLAGLATARAKGKKLGRREKVPDMKRIREYMEKGLSERASVLASGYRLSTYYKWKKEGRLNIV
jgi:putative DNA-invertase from lambdoid prophage Rac